MIDNIESMDVGIQNDGEPVAVESATPVTPPAESLADAGEQAAEEQAGTPDATEDHAEESPEERKRKSGSQREREKRLRLEAENEALRQILAQQGQPKPAPAALALPDQPKPKIDDFETHEEWVEAISDWKYEQRRAAERIEAEKTTAQTEWERKCAEGRTKFPDFDDLLQEAPAPSPLVAQRLFKPTTTPEVIHFLASNLNEYDRINRMRDSGDVAEALAEIKIKLATPPKIKPPSAAPAPIRPVTPRAAVIKPECLRGIEDF